MSTFSPPKPNDLFTIRQDTMDWFRQEFWEAIFSQSNGLLGVRGSLEEPVDDAPSKPMSFMAGLYNTLPEGLPELPMLPDWLDTIVTRVLYVVIAIVVVFTAFFAYTVWAETQQAMQSDPARRAIEAVKLEVRQDPDNPVLRLTLGEALESSLNVPFARLGMAVGPERIVTAAHAMGIESPLNPYPSIALGASEVSPLELTRAFGVLAAEGFRPELKSVLWGAENENGLEGGATSGSGPRGSQQAFDPAETYLVTSALRGAVERGTGRGLRDRGFYGDVAAKSGTTNDFRDGWFIGYTPSIAVGVWVGFDHGKRLEIPGASVALPIFADFLEEAVGPSGREGPWGSEGFSYPSGLEMVDVDPVTGLRGGWGCRGEPELFLTGTAPQEGCSSFGLDSRTFRILAERGGDEFSRLIRRLLEGEEQETNRRRRSRRDER